MTSPDRSAARPILIAGCALGFLSVALGAFGAHGLKDLLPPDRLAVFETGVRYAMFHTGALLAAGAVGWLGSRGPYRAAGAAFLAGVVLFSGSLWLLALTGLRWLGAITPLGGLSFLTGWVLLALAARRLDWGGSGG